MRESDFVMSEEPSESVPQSGREDMELEEGGDRGQKGGGEGQASRVGEEEEGAGGEQEGGQEDEMGEKERGV